MKREHESYWQRVAGQMEDGCAILAGIIAGLGLWSWWAGFGDLLAFAPEFVPMAPSTALIMMAASLAVFLLHRWPGRLAVVRFAGWTAGLTGLVGLWAALRPWFGWGSPVEEWLSWTSRRVDDIPLGQMSPLTGVTFLAVAAALLLRLLPSGRFPQARRPSALLALGVALMGLAVAGSYAVGQPWLYGGSVIPMALWTALAFLCLGLGLLGLVAVELSPAEAGEMAGGRGLSLAHLVITSLLILIISLAGVVHLRHSLHHSLADAGNLLKTIGDLKTAEIVEWRKKRLQDAEFLARAPVVGQHVEDYLANPAPGPARTQLLQLLGAFQGRERLTAVAFFDTNSAPRLAVPEWTGAAPPFLRNLLADAFRSNRVVLSDLYREGEGSAIGLDIVIPVWAPVSAPDSPSAPTHIRRVLGMMVFRSDARRFLFPLVESWPTPSPSAETLLVRREGDELVFLNELRHRRGAALNLRMVISTHPDLPTSRAVSGETGVVEGMDYRGAQVLAAIRPIPISPWFLITKVDREEIFAPLQAQAWLILALTVMLAAAAGMVVHLAWQRRRVADMRRELALAQRVEHLMKSANDAILLADATWRIVEANDRATETYGYTQAELCRLRLADLCVPEGRAECERHVAQLLATGHGLFETTHRRKDGSVFPVENSARVIDLDGVSYRLVILRDMTERKAQEREIERLNRLYRTLSEINQSIVRLQTREELFANVCRIAAQFAGFKVVWIGLIDPETQEVRPVGRAGEKQAYLDTVRVYADDRPEGRGAVGTCIREGRACMIRDFACDPRTAHRRDAAAAHGLRSALAVPIRLEGKVCGAFTVYSEEPGIFQEREAALLEEAALDISFALDNLEHEARRRQAEAALRESEAALRALSSRQEAILDSVPDIIAEVDANKVYTWMNPAGLKFFGEDAVGRSAAHYFEGEQDTFEVVQPVFTGDTGVIYLESWQRRQDGEKRLLAWWCCGLRDGNGMVTGALSSARDITDQKRAEEALRESETRFRSLFDTMNELVALHELVCDASGRPVDYRIVDCNPTFSAVTGLSRERAVGALASELYGTGEAPFLDIYARVTETGRPFLFEAFFAPMSKHFRISVFSPGPGRFATVAADITGRKRAEEALRQAEEKYRGIFENSTIGIFQSTPEGRLLAVNPAFTAMHGYASPAECLAGIWDIARQLYVEPARRLEFQRQLEEQGRVLRFENQVYRKDGSKMWVATSARANRDAQGRILHYEGFVEDITERKRLEQERMEMEAQMRQQQKLESIGTLAGGVAHEINNPIMGVMNYAQLIADQAAPESPAKEYAREIIHETERVAAIVKNLLQFARHEKHTHSPARMHDIVEQTLSLIRTVMRHDQVTLKVEISPDLPALKCRNQQIQQVVMNLLTNARDALNDKYPGHHDDKIIAVTCRLFHWDGRRWLRLTVEDHGNGVPAGVRDRIFDPFFTTKPREKGTGLGLSISHSIVKEHHGQMLFETEPGRFTRFHVELPVDNGWELAEKEVAETPT